MASYLKLGEKAEGFFDSVSRLKVTKGQVIKVDSVPKTAKVLKAIKNGHLEKTTSEEFEKLNAKSSTSVEPVKDPMVEEKSLEFFMAMKKDEIVAWAKEFGFNAGDMETLESLKKVEMAQFMVDTIPEYSDDPEGDDPED